MRIENEFLKVDVTLEGGNLTSIYDKKNNEELLYQKDERSWMGQDVVIFPVVARLKDGSYHVDGKEYFLKNHGVIRYSKLSVVTYKDDEIISWYNELFLMPLAWVCETSFDKEKENNVDFMIISAENF